MAEIDNTIALQAGKVPPPPDIIGPITSLAQLQYLQAHGSLENAQAQFQQYRTGAVQQYGTLRGAGASPQDALDQSNLNAVDPAAGNAILSNIGTGRTLDSNAAYAKTGDPNSLAIQGPAAVTAGAGASQSLADLNAKKQYASTGDPSFLRAISPESYTAGINAAKSQGDVAIQRLGMAGQVANGVLAMGDVNGNPPQGGIPSSVRQDAVSKALSMGIINQQQAAAESKMSDGDFWNIAKSWAAAGQGAKDFAETSGRAAAGQAAGHAANTPEKLSPGESLVVPNAATLPASSGGTQGPNYYGVVSQHESGNNPGAVNPNGGAAGLYQFMPGTWSNLRQTHPELGLTPNGATDPAQATKAMQAFTMDNAKQLSDAGVAVNDKSLFMAHFLGGAGASKFIQAASQNPDTPAAQLFPAEAKQNSTIFYGPNGAPRSLGQVYSMMTQRFGSGLTATSISGPQAGFSVQPSVMPSAGAGPQAPQTPLQSAAALPVPPIGQRPQSPTAAPASPQGTVAPIAQAPTQPAPGPAPGSVPNAPGVTVLSPGMSLGQKAELEGQGKAYGELPAQLDTAASSAKKMNTTLDEVTQAADGSWQSGKWAPVAENLREGMQSVANSLGIQTPGLDKSIANYQDFVKMAGNISRAAAHETSSQVGVQEMELINKSLPSPEVSDGGIKLIVPQMKGLNDFSIAKQQAASQFRTENNGSLGPSPKYGNEDFQTYWNQAASPAAFVLHRMAVDNPQGARDLLMKMKSQPNGDQALRNIAEQTKWAHDAGLLN